jgi:hypothetical protein
MLLPEEGTVPAKVTAPAAGATTVAPRSSAMSMPRWNPAAYGCARSKLNGWTTSPRAGQVHAAAVGTKLSAARTAGRSKRRIGTSGSR